MPILATSQPVTVQRIITATLTDEATGESTTITGIYLVQVPRGT
jgi:uncharacterized protein YndB with AHSA1/START domain